MKTTMFVAALAFAGTTAFAAPLLPGGSVNFLTPGYAVAPPGGLPIATLNTPFVYSGIGSPFSGILTSEVYNEGGFLTFVYRVSNTSTTTESFGAYTVNGFGGWAIDAGVMPIGPGLFPFDIERSLSGGEVTSLFGNTGSPLHGRVLPGMTSDVTILRTNATQYGHNIGAVIDGSVAGNIDILAPIPTPGAGALLGLGTLAAFRRRR